MTGCEMASGSQACRLSDYRAAVLSNERATETLYVMELAIDAPGGGEAPEGGLAGCIQPGQFVHMSIPTLDSHILRRPFSVYAADPVSGNIEILYQVVGEGTAEMIRWKAGQQTTMIGPIGHGWHAPENARRALLVGGGVGAAPLFMLCKQLIERGVQVDVVLGAATKEALVCRGRYEDVCGCPPACSTDDGTFGREGFCTSLVEEAVARAVDQAQPYDYGAVCGPEPLMRIASKTMTDAGIPCQVSMERRMACGIGACLSCVVDTTSGKKRSCVDGPVFNASEVVW